MPPARDVPAAADLVLHGRSVLPSRSALADVVRRRDEAATGATEVALSLLDLAPDRMDHAAALQALADWVHRGVAPTARERARVAVVLHDRWVRDAVLARWLPDLDWVADVPLPEDLGAVTRQLRPWPSTAYQEGLDRLLTLVSQVPRDLGGPLLTLVAMVAWTRGTGPSPTRPATWRWRSTPAPSWRVCSAARWRSGCARPGVRARGEPTDAPGGDPADDRRLEV